MEFSVESLLKSGFTKRELRYIYNNIYSFGGTLEEIVRDLAKRFKILIFILSFFCLSFIISLFFPPYDRLISYGVGLIIASIILVFIQPPVISFKCWRFCRGSKN
ncbi:hypothetical protein SY86_16875 [Erwinia tracheiphila]|uniref:Uncharacterized protein n=1 Tax=Erwinia tracheiphila TaxID=65700 RepID=A0A0M2KHI8_9GAMM|nr:hypothetical protein AV903_18970 [Erwinia tracheiphila]KKF36718.1 hypothetical protein SY86_16875 [Erwinia tracheiphila]